MPINPQWSDIGTLRSPNGIKLKLYSIWGDTKAVHPLPPLVWSFSDRHSWHVALRISLCLQVSLYSCQFSEQCKIQTILRHLFSNNQQKTGMIGLSLAQRLSMLLFCFVKLEIFQSWPLLKFHIFNSLDLRPALYLGQCFDRTTDEVRSMRCFPTLTRSKGPFLVDSSLMTTD